MKLLFFFFPLRICHSQSRDCRSKGGDFTPEYFFFITRIHTFACKLDVVLANVLRVEVTPLRGFFLLQYVGSFPVAGADQSARAEYVRSKLLQLRVSSYLYYFFERRKSLVQTELSINTRSYDSLLAKFLAKSELRLKCTFPNKLLTRTTSARLGSQVYH